MQVNKKAKTRRENEENKTSLLLSIGIPRFFTQAVWKCFLFPLLQASLIYHARKVHRPNFLSPPNSCDPVVAPIYFLQLDDQASEQ